MDRMGHSTARAALIYQHRRSDRQHTMAEALSKLAEAELNRTQKARKRTSARPSGTQRARRTQSETRKPK
jgi:hypothetical protein